ncbi:hypothetical protein K523DRAFT_272728 [Schizophyllum commune Tattone D]|nr:hypothetical protein K523DRAFT_272728 [Schizophyllum commune Tattone D]
MPSLSTVKQFNASVTSSAKTPVGIFIGGTSGIGRGMAAAFARHMKGNARLIIIGRNKAAADVLIASLPSPANKLSEFLACDCSLMRNVDAACEQLAKRDLDKINYLVLTIGAVDTISHEKTAEGLDKNWAAMFFGRFRFIQNLAPALDRAADAGEEARVMTVIRAGVGAPLEWDELDMSRNGLKRWATQMPTYHDFAMAGFAKRHPKVSFIHAAPGIVWTPLFLRSRSLFVKILAYLFAPLLWLFSVTEEQCGEHMMYGLYQSKPGFSDLGEKGDVIEPGYKGTDEEVERLWNWAYDRPGVPYKQ